MLKAGDLFLGPYPPGSNKPRRFIILSDEIAEDDPRVAWVYVSTSMNDPTVVLKQGCHPDITKDCCVIYEEAGLVRAADIRIAVSENVLTASQEPLTASLVATMQEGIFASEDTPMRVVKFCTDRI